ncbi:hypothetical protein FDP41_002111 [Naegleria fowleri]|uniref:Uncharacterized protein n=1 Tax=Naegleria fowleri TaxID=5763 RepID=A0A6A5BX19_NAEFO|nr:uncharacterized protein FDP41_002111 [Naegleria fowleri]KAF0979041.1 hypothetical protein FDP41_002111 [Naegleria fowleri]
MKKALNRGSSSSLREDANQRWKSPRTNDTTSTIGNKSATLKEIKSDKYKFKAPFIEEFLEQLQDEKKSKATTPTSSTKDFLTMLLKQQEKRMKKQEEDRAELENSFSNMEYLVKKQQYLQKLRKKVLPNANFTPFVLNTLQFFEDNISYFAEHSIEFQRLIAQLRTKEERQIFLHSVYMYYYADILLEMRKLQNNQQNESKYHTFYGMASTDDLYRRYFESTKITQPNLTNTDKDDISHQNVNSKRIGHCLAKFEKGFKDSEELYDLVNTLNSRESLIIEACLKEMEVFKQRCVTK